MSSPSPSPSSLPAIDSVFSEFLLFFSFVSHDIELLGFHISSNWIWYFLYLLILFLFYLFSSPFTDNREQRNKWSGSGYVYLSTCLYVWLSCGIAMHFPPFYSYSASASSPLSTDDSDSSSSSFIHPKVAISLFSPLVLFSTLTLFTIEGIIKILNKWFVFHVGWRRHSVEVIQNSIIISAACCIVYSQCGDQTQETLNVGGGGGGYRETEGTSTFTSPFASWDTFSSFSTSFSMRNFSFLSSSPSSPLSAHPLIVSKVCGVLFSGHSTSWSHQIPSIFILWCTFISLLVSNFALERLSPHRGVFVETTKKNNKISSEKGKNITESERGDSALDSSPMGARSPLSPTSDSLSHSPHSASPSSSSSAISPHFSTMNLSNTDAHRYHSLYNSLLSSVPYSRLITPTFRRSLFFPTMLEMTEWYAIMTFTTAIDLLIHLGLFLGRFDMRTLQAAMPNTGNQREGMGMGMGKEKQNNVSASTSPSSLLLRVPRIVSASELCSLPSPSPSSPFYYDHFSLPSTGSNPHDNKNDFWFDWMSDCGDGWCSSYQISRLLAMPTLNVLVKKRNHRQWGNLSLPRAKLLLIGGDLAYPNPSSYSYEKRFFKPFECALPPPPHYDPDQISLQKPNITGGLHALREYEGPQMFCIPGNHDWFDGLQSYLRYICARDFLGGWLVPQQKSWFCLQLPLGWWIFAVDNALSEDIDVTQFQYFANISHSMGESDRVVLCCHEPDWIINAHNKVDDGKNIYQLIKMLNGKVAIRLAGDLHNYTRHMPWDMEVEKDGQKQRQGSSGSSRKVQPTTSPSASSSSSSSSSSSTSVSDSTSSFPILSPSPSSSISPSHPFPLPSPLNRLLRWAKQIFQNKLEVHVHCPFIEDIQRDQKDRENNFNFLRTDKGTLGVEPMGRNSSQPETNIFNLAVESLEAVANGATDGDGSNNNSEFSLELERKEETTTISFLDSPRQTHEETEIPIGTVAVDTQKDMEHDGSKEGEEQRKRVNNVGNTQKYNYSVPSQSSSSTVSVSSLSSLVSLPSVGVNSAPSSPSPSPMSISYPTTSSPPVLPHPHVPPTSPSDWSENDLISYLNSPNVNLSFFVPFVFPHGIDGSLFISLTEKDILSDLQIQSSLKRKKILCEIRKLKQNFPKNIMNSKGKWKTEKSDIFNHNSASSPHLSQSDEDHEDSPIQMARTVSNGFLDKKTNPISHHHSQSLVSLQTLQTPSRSPSPSSFPPPPPLPLSSTSGPICVVSGGGGAFMHPTHVPSTAPINVNGVPYVRSASYPSIATSRAYAILNIFAFRKRNWRFDIVGGVCYFLMVASLLPLCHLSHVLSAPTLLELVWRFYVEVAHLHLSVLSTSYVSLFALLSAWIILININESSWPMGKRILVGTIHTLSHTIGAYSILLFVELCVDVGIKKGVMGKDDLFLVFLSAFPKIHEVLLLMDTYTMGITMQTFRIFTAIVDVPEALALLKTEMCTNAAEMTRGQMLMYYFTNGLYLWVLFAPMVSFLVGTYLYISSSFLNAHMTEAFSSLRIESFKNFLRFHITDTGDLEMFVLGIDRVPKKWKRNTKWSGHTENSPSYMWKEPSVWIPEEGEPDRVRLVDYICIHKEKEKGKDKEKDKDKLSRT